MKFVNILLLIILLVTTLIDLIPLLFRGSKLAKYQKYAYIFYIIAAIGVFFDGQAANTIFWILNAIISFLFGQGNSHNTYFVLLGILSIVWVIFILLGAAS